MFASGLLPRLHDHVETSRTNRVRDCYDDVKAIKLIVKITLCDCLFWPHSYMYGCQLTIVHRLTSKMITVLDFAHGCVGSGFADVLAFILIHESRLAGSHGTPLQHSLASLGPVPMDVVTEISLEILYMHGHTGEKQPQMQGVVRQTAGLS